METTRFENIDDYIYSFPIEIQEKLEKVRATIKDIAPEAEEKISYAIPTFVLNNRNLVHFAAFKNHLGFYPTPAAGEEFKEELLVYKTGKGSVQFPYHQELPLDLISRIVRFRVQEISSKSSKRK